jgi:hypothetical protein
LGIERRHPRSRDDPGLGSTGPRAKPPTTERLSEAPGDDRAFESRLPEPSRPRTSFRAAVELIALIAAPTALLTALAYYFGVRLSAARAEYFGIDNSVLHFTTRDYVLRSVDALFVPLGALFVAAILGLAVHSLASRHLDDERVVGPLRWTSRAAGTIGFIVFAICVYAVFRELPFHTYYLLPSLGLGIGLIVLAYAVYIEREVRANPHKSADASTRRPLSVPFIVLVALVGVLSMFWATSDYAAALGRGRAKNLADNLDTRPGVVVYSERQLGIAGPGVIEQRVNGAAAYRFRYKGLRLLIESDRRFFLLPQGWTRSNGTVIVLPDTPSTRLEFSPGS